MSTSTLSAPRRHAAYTFFDRLPYWLLAVLLIGVFFVWRIATNETYTTIFFAVSRGIYVTVTVTLVAFTGAVLLGLAVGLARVSKNRVVYEWRLSTSRSSAACPCWCSCST